MLTTWQQRVLTTAVRFIGYPYVWGGEFERPQSPYGAQPQGGFDCSGFAWRVYKVQSYPGAPQLAEVLRGRTAAAMAGEVPRRLRIKPARLAPADLMFFGPGGPHAQPARIDHVGISLGNGWLIQSSRYGVALEQVDRLVPAPPRLGPPPTRRSRPVAALKPSFQEHAFSP